MCDRTVLENPLVHMPNMRMRRLTVLDEDQNDRADRDRSKYCSTAPRFLLQTVRFDSIRSRWYPNGFSEAERRRFGATL